MQVINIAMSSMTKPKIQDISNNQRKIKNNEVVEDKKKIVIIDRVKHRRKLWYKKNGEAVTVTAADSAVLGNWGGRGGGGFNRPFPRLESSSPGISTRGIYTLFLNDFFFFLLFKYTFCGKKIS